MIRVAWLLAAQQFRSAHYRTLALLGAGVSLILLFAFYALFLSLIGALTEEGLVLFDGSEITGLGTFFTGKSLFFMIFLSMFLMVPVASVFTGLYLHDVADMVEEIYYPHLPRPERPSGYETFRLTFNYIGLLLPANIVAMIIFGLSGFFWGMVFFYALNGWLLAREYGDMIASRRLPPGEVKAVRRQHRRSYGLCGVMLANGLSIPLVNLLMPVLGAAAFTHLHHLLSRPVSVPA